MRQEEELTNMVKNRW